MNNKSITDDLKTLIKQTYVIENEYKNLKKSYDFLTDTLAKIIEELPSAVWILDKNNNVFLQNKIAMKKKTLFSALELKNAQNLKIPHKQLQLRNKFYQIKIAKSLDKTIVLATDITDEKRNERLVSMGQISAHLAHEIRNPIGSISLLLSILLEKLNPKDRQIAITMQDAIKRVERIIRNTLLFTKGITPNKTLINSSDLKSRCQIVFNEYCQINAKIELDFEDFKLNGDLELLMIVFSNLIYNAVDAIEEKIEENYEECDSEVGIVKIKAKKINKKIVFVVEDNGVEFKNIEIFKAYETTKLKGNGLGLSLSREIIQAHAGSIKVQKSPKAFIITF